MFTSLIGHYPGAVDAKKRSIIPAAFREALRAEKSRSIIISRSLSDKPRELCFFFPSQWELVKENPLSFLSRFGVKEEDYDPELFFGNCFELFLDEQGRILFRQDQLEEAELGKNIIYVGVNDHGIIRDRDEYEAERKEKVLARKQKRPSAALRENKQAGAK
ncbi:MAG: hypothetical protein K5838_03120 [Elusimicrobiales bacterium]|nr:hypothetical protein [Elusimicrobiales bacterium]